MRGAVNLSVALLIGAGSFGCGRRHSEVVVSGQPLLEALCASWLRCAGELGPLGTEQDCVAALGTCGTVVFVNHQAELNACTAAVEQATCFDLAETPFRANPLLDRFNDGRRGGELLLAWLQRRLGTCGDLWWQRPAENPGLGGDCGARLCAEPHSYCDRSKITCEAQGRTDDGCAATTNGNTDCRQGLVCDPNANRCSDWPLYGPGEDCAGDLWCNTGLCAERGGSVKCRLKVEPGGWCDRDDVCYGHRACRANTCVDRGGDGAACDTDAQCLLGYRCRDAGAVRQCQSAALCP